MLFLFLRSTCFLFKTCFAKKRAIATKKSLGRKQALDFLRKSGTADPEAIRRLESGCKVVWTEDDPTLPPGKIIKPQGSKGIRQRPTK